MFPIGQNIKREEEEAACDKSAEFLHLFLQMKGGVKFLHGLKLRSSQRSLDSKHFESCHHPDSDENDDDGNDYDAIMVMKRTCASFPGAISSAGLFA